MKTIQDVKNFLQELIGSNKMYHPEDDAHNIINGLTGQPLFTYEQAEEMNKKMELATSICKENDMDICEIGLELLDKSE